MLAFKIKRSLFILIATLLLGSMLSGCGQMGPLTLPQSPAEVSKPDKNNSQPSDNTSIQSGGEGSGPV
ncbi:LPS translocon maturation chaperone LptM [Rheinheimera sp. MMS21-TC3]|uniref:LPS translocon maturation chaperone LptM n=1 Tax=Rheinheimera sp. MMS21-TC3 TaxID=3072790 RepID=UPI00391F86CB